MKLWIPPPVQMVTIVVVMWLIDRQFPSFRIFFPGQIKIGTVLIGLGIAIEVISILSFIRARTTVNPIQPGKASKLVVGGLYRFSRNPMYAGMLLLLTGWALRLGNPLNIVFIGVFVFAITVLQIKPEEKILAEKFGAEYDDYRRKVRRWI